MVHLFIKAAKMHVTADGAQPPAEGDGAYEGMRDALMRDGKEIG